MRGTGRVMFAATMLLLVGVLNIIYGIGALDDANIFKGDTRYVLDDLNTLGWVLILLGALQLGAGFSLMSGNAFGAFWGSSPAASAPSAHCSPSAVPIRGGRLRCSTVCLRRPRDHGVRGGRGHGARRGVK